MAQDWVALKKQWEADADDWSFWIEWYQAILNGTPLPWELTQRIALDVTDAEWDAGPKEVAKAIAPIYLPYKLKRQIEELQAELAMAVPQERGIGDNNPPEPIEEVEIERLPEIIWADVAMLSTETASSQLNPSRLRWFHERLSAAAKKISQLGKDIAYDQTKQIASGTIGAGLALNWPKIQSLIAEITQTIAQWILYLT